MMCSSPKCEGPRVSFVGSRAWICCGLLCGEPSRRPKRKPTARCPQASQRCLPTHPPLSSLTPSCFRRGNALCGALGARAWCLQRRVRKRQEDERKQERLAAVAFAKWALQLAGRQVIVWYEAAAVGGPGEQFAAVGHTIQARRRSDDQLLLLGEVCAPCSSDRSHIQSSRRSDDQLLLLGEVSHHQGIA